MNKLAVLMFAAAAALMLASCDAGNTGGAASVAADYVFINGQVYTVNENQPRAEAVAVKGTDIVYVGDDQGAEKFIGDNTKVTDLESKTMLPGFIDTHHHGIVVMATAAGLMMATPPDGVGDKAKMLQAVAEWLAAHPDGPFFSFGGSFEGLVDITRHDIDRIVADQPFVMVSGTGHGGWANTRALEGIGVVKGEPDPIDHYEREADGTPTGYIGSSAAVFYIVGKLGLFKPEYFAANAEGVLAGSSANGLTATLQAGYIQGTEDGVFPMIEQLEKAGKLPVRISSVALQAQRPIHIEHGLANLDKFVPRYNSELFRVDAMKIHGDGDTGGYTIGMLEPFSDAESYDAYDPSKPGLISFPDTDQLVEFMIESLERGASHIHMHAIGDATLRQALDAFERVRAAGYTDARLSTGHTNIIHPDDLPRFAELNVMADFHAQYAVPSELGYSRFGEERIRERGFRTRSLWDSGGIVTIGSDFPAGEENPFLSIAVIISRREPGKSEVLPPADEALSIEQAIQAYTLNGARLLGMEDIIGSIEVGKRADLIVVDRNILEATPEEIVESKVLTTMMNGKVRHDVAFGLLDK